MGVVKIIVEAIISIVIFLVVFYTLSGNGVWKELSAVLAVAAGFGTFYLSIRLTGL